MKSSPLSSDFVGIHSPLHLRWRGGYLWGQRVGILFLLLSFVIINSPAEARLAEIGLNPLNVEASSRPLGMGGAYVGVDDVNSIFYNPAGLAWSKGLALTFKDFNNLSYLQAYPTGYGAAVGLAVISRQVSVGTATSSSNLVYLSYGSKLSLLPYLEENELCQKIGFGINLKGLMSETLKVTGSTDRAATGWDSDLGLLWKGSEWWAAGISLQNIHLLGGGTIRWDDGSTEAVPQSVRLGWSGKFLGEINTPFYVEGREFLLDADLDLAGASPQVRVGGEWVFDKQFYLRAGFLSSELTFGMGAKFENWSIDFANYKDTGERVSYVTLTYYPKEWIVFRSLDSGKPSVILEQPFEKFSLEDNYVTYDDRIEVSGEVKTGVSVNINGLKAFLDNKNTFKVVVPLQVGKNLIVVEAQYQGEKKIWRYKVLRKVKVSVEGKPKEVVRQKEKVEELVTLGVIEITPEAQFKLEASVTRGELATWLAKATGLRLPKIEKDLFPDVRADNPLAPYIKAIVDWGLLTPYADGTFRPDAPVSKEEGEKLFKLLEKQK